MSDAAVDTGTTIPGEAEARAREMGWRPEDEWEGDKSGWMDADTFIDRQDRRRNVANEEFKVENEKLLSQVAALTTEQAETRQTIEDFKVWQTKSEERAYKKALKALQAEQREAVKLGDEAAFDVASQEIGELVKDAQDGQAKPAQKPRNADEIPAYKAWKVKNDWYLDDMEATEYADRISGTVGRKGNFNDTDPAFYDAITAEVKKKFPDKFKNPNRERANAVEEGGGAKAQKGKKTAADLPAEVRATGNRFVKQKLFKNINEYAEQYFAQEE